MLKKTITYLRESQAEFRKIVWPSREEVVGATVVVCVSVTIIALILVGYDFVIKGILQVVQGLIL